MWSARVHSTYIHTTLSKNRNGSCLNHIRVSILSFLFETNDLCFRNIYLKWENYLEGIIGNLYENYKTDINSYYVSYLYFQKWSYSFASHSSSFFLGESSFIKLRHPIPKNLFRQWTNQSLSNVPISNNFLMMQVIVLERPNLIISFLQSIKHLLSMELINQAT